MRPYVGDGEANTVIIDPNVLATAPQAPLDQDTHRVDEIRSPVVETLVRDDGEERPLRVRFTGRVVDGIANFYGIPYAHAGFWELPHTPNIEQFEEQKLESA